MNKTLHTVATFHTEIEMIPIKAALENEGITCIIKDEYVTQMREFSYAGNSGIKLQVGENDLAKALLILKDLGHSDLEDWQETTKEKKLENWLSNNKILSKILNVKLPYLLLFILLIVLMVFLRN
jgi:hypothetical protein